MYKNEVTVVESKPDQVMIDDLRIITPFPELVEFSNIIVFGDLDDATHKHVPYSIILMHVLNKWKQEVCN